MEELLTARLGCLVLGLLEQQELEELELLEELRQATRVEEQWLQASAAVLLL